MRKTLLVFAAIAVMALTACAAETTEPIEPTEDGGDVLAGGEGDEMPPPGELPGMSDAPTNEPGPVLVEQPDFGFIAELPADAILVQQEIEPTFSMPSMMQPFGRVAPFTLYADGRLFMRADEGWNIVTTQLSTDEVTALMENLWVAGYGRVGSYEDMCAPGPEGETPCLADAPITVLRVRTGPDDLRTTRHYGNFAEDMAALETVLATLNGYPVEGAELYTPQGATLLVRQAAGAEPQTVAAWPLEVELSSLMPATDAVNGMGGVVALDAEQAAAMVEALGTNVGTAFVEAEDGTLANVELVPWLPTEDYTEAIQEWSGGQ